MSASTSLSDLRLGKHETKFKALGVESLADLRALKTSEALLAFCKDDAGLSSAEAARLASHLRLPATRSGSMALPAIVTGLALLALGGLLFLFPERLVTERSCAGFVADAESRGQLALDEATGKLAALQKLFETEGERVRQLQQQLDAAKLTEQKLREELATASRLSSWALNQTQSPWLEEQQKTREALLAMQVTLMANQQQDPAGELASEQTPMLDGPKAPPSVPAAQLPEMLSGIAKWVLQPGTGSPPRGADEVRFGYSCTLDEASNRTAVLSGSDVGLSMGARTPLPGLDAALRSMLPAERALFSLSAAEAFGADGESALGVPPHATVHCELELRALTPVEDVSAAADRSVLKTRLVVGRGVETPADGARVVLRATARSATNGSVINSTGEATWEMALGDGSCSEGLRLALMSMQRAETARLNVSAPMARDPTLGLAGDEAVVLEVELLGFTQARALQTMGAAELTEHVTQIKQSANDHFKAGERAAACAEYERGWHLLRAFRVSPRAADAPADEAAAMGSLELALRLNSAACSLSDAKHAEALAHADAALALSPNSSKAHYRRGQALRGLGRVADAEGAFASVLAIEPRNKEAHAELAALAEATAAGGGGGAAVGVAVGATGAVGAAALIGDLTALKQKANGHFKAGERAVACAEYARGLGLLEGAPADATEEEAASLGSLELALRLNSAACSLSDAKHAEALAHADAALALSPSSAKAHYRRGQALRGLGRVADAEGAFASVLAIEPRNKEAHAELEALRG